MSYILDALRKSDAQRRRGATPALLTPQAAAATAGGPRRSLSYGLLAAGLIGAGIMIGWMRPWQTEQRAAATDAATVRLLESSPRPSASVPLPEGREPARRSTPSAPAQKSPPAAQIAPAPAATTMKRQLPAPARVEPRTPAQEPNVVMFSELPVAIQQEIPRVSISVHAYSSVPKERLIGINDRVLREGEYAAPGLLLEQITPEGMVMSYKGYRFRRGVR